MDQRLRRDESRRFLCSLRALRAVGIPSRGARPVQRSARAGDLGRLPERHQLPPRTPGNNSWLALVAAATASGRIIERVRIAARPLSDYTRFEFAAYPENVAAGEKIRVLERRLLQGADRTWADDDFWIFDDETVVLLGYDEDRRFLRAEQVGNVDPYLVARQRALALSVDFADFPGR
jgi:hypothetical protein